MELTKSQEEYIKTIYILKNTVNSIRVTDIAIKLGISKPSVTRSIKNLSSIGMLNYEPYSNISLTSEGEKVARQIIKRQDTLKTFFSEILDVEDEKAEKEAKDIKHYLSKETQLKLENHVNGILNLGSSNCNCDEESSKCKTCIKRLVQEKLKNRGRIC